YSYSLSHFFFQAEDGIRDFHVTGVQTCALPICRRPQARLEAFHITFFGTQPTLTQVPPSRAPSMTADLAPWRAARRAVARPPLPPPIESKSKCSVICTTLSFETTGPYLSAAIARPLRAGALLGSAQGWRRR